MSRFTSTKRIDTRWRNNDFIGEPGSSHTFADALHEEFLVDWAYQIQIGDIVITETPTTGNIQVATLTVGDIVLTGTATGNFGGGGAATVVQGTAPISVSTSSNTATVSLNASYSTSTHLHDGTYQPFGTYVTSVAGTAPITTSGTTAVTVGINQSAITANSATNAEVIRTYVKNTTGSAMTKGQAVYVNGADGTNVTIQLSTASTEAGSSKTLGLLAQDLANNAFGYVIENGLLAEIDTSTATAGQTVWLGNTPGSRVYGAPPAEPSNSVYLGIVARSNVNNGEILVKVQNGYELDELHDVSVGSPSDGDIVQWKSSSAMWTKASISGAGIAASVHTHATSDVTSGNFVATLGAGTGVTVTGADGNASAKTVAIGQAVATNSNVTFNNISVGGNVSHLSQLDVIVNTVTAASIVSGGVYLPPNKTIIFEGSTDNAQETELTVANPTEDRTITLPDATGTVALTNSGYTTISNATGTATTISSTTSSAPTDISGLTFTFTPTYTEDVLVTAALVFTQSAAPTAQVDIISRIILDGTIVSPQGGFTRLAANHSSPTGFTQAQSHTFLANSGTSYTVKVAAYKSAAQGTFSASNISSFSIIRVRA